MKNPIFAAAVLVLSALSLNAASAFAIPNYSSSFQPEARATAKSAIGTDFVTTLFDDITRYQIGDVFGKKPVTAAEMQRDAILRRQAMATARYYSFMGGATGWYVGKFNGHHIVATNHHVANAEDGINCSSASIAFPFLTNDGTKKIYKCEHLLGTWSDIDFGLVSITVPASDEALFANLGRNMKWDAQIHNGEELLTVGYGIALNAGQKNMMYNTDNDCKVYSGDNEFKFMGDPDEVNPGPYKAWSFSIGCDISHGDSGSAFVDRNTGDVIGIVWTGGIPKGGKPAQVRTRAFMDSLTPASPEVWTMLSYAVPAVKIHEHLAGVVAGGKLPADDAKTITEILK